MSTTGLVLAPFTEGATLPLVPIGEGISLTGKSLKVSGYALEGNTEKVENELIKAGVGAAVGAGAKKVLKMTEPYTTNFERVIQESVMGGADKVIQNSVERVIDDK